MFTQCTPAHVLLPIFIIICLLVGFVAPAPGHALIDIRSGCIYSRCPVSGFPRPWTYMGTSDKYYKGFRQWGIWYVNVYNTHRALILHPWLALGIDKFDFYYTNWILHCIFLPSQNVKFQQRLPFLPLPTCRLLVREFNVIIDYWIGFYTSWFFKKFLYVLG